MQKIALFYICLFFGSLSLRAQFTVNGFVKDSLSGERIIGANIFTLHPQRGTVSNAYGYYSFGLSTETDSVEIIFSCVGYESIRYVISTKSDLRLDVNLSPGLILNEVSVSSSAINNKPLSSVLQMPMKSINTMPKLLGEADMMRVFQLMPGVTAGQEGTSGLNVRGGSPDQNLILLDDVPLYNVNHIAGFISVFNPDALNSVLLYKGGFGAQYGGRVSSVMDVRMKEGNQTERNGFASIGLLASKLSWETPLIKDKSSLIISIRRSLFDLFTRAYLLMHYNKDHTSAGYYIIDFNAKANYKISNKDHLFLSFYSGRDRLFVNQRESDSYDNKYKAKGERHTQWGNQMAALRWNHIYNNKIFSNTTLGYTRFYYDISSKIERKTVEGPEQKTKATLGFDSNISDVFLKNDFDYYRSDKQKIKLGASLSYRRFNPSDNFSTFSRDNTTLSDINQESQKYNAFEIVAYIQDEHKPLDYLTASYGLRLSSFFIDNKAFCYAEPRLGVSLSPFQNVSFKASYSYMIQPVHLLSNSGVGLPADLWVPATKSAPPEYAHQLVLGSTFKIPFIDFLDFCVEAYYKTMGNLIEYKDAVSLYSGPGEWQEKIEAGGKGTAYGIELFIEKKTGKNTGWISYTLSESVRQFDNINNAKKYPYVYSHPHDLSIVLSRKIRSSVRLTLVWVYNSGNNITVPDMKNIVVSEQSGFNTNDYLSPGFIYSESHIYPEKNNFRMPSYHRLDVSLSFEKKRKGKKAVLSLDVYNAYCRLNPYYLYFKKEQNGKISLWSFTPFPIIPSISYSFAF